MKTKNIARTSLQEIGAMGEEEVSKYLSRTGYVLIDRNWRIKGGEIDLIFEDGQTIVFVEVKTRSSNTYGTPFDAITPEKAFRLQRLALAWMALNQRWGQDYRIDAAGVWIKADGECSIELRKAVL
ncbi:MAG: YraN family protein [Actinomycetes bacterium]|jgi:putative endonuclease